MARRSASARPMVWLVLMMSNVDVVNRVAALEMICQCETSSARAPAIFRCPPPWKKVEFEIERRQWRAGSQLGLRGVGQLEEMPFLAFRGAFEEHDLASLHGVERAGANLARLVGELRAQFAVLGNV